MRAHLGRLKTDDKTAKMTDAKMSHLHTRAQKRGDPKAAPGRLLALHCVRHIRTPLTPFSVTLRPEKR